MAERPICCNHNCREGRDCPLRTAAPDFICEWEYVLALVGSICEAAKKYGPRIVLLLAAAVLLGVVLAR